MKIKEGRKHDAKNKEDKPYRKGKLGAEPEVVQFHSSPKKTAQPFTLDCIKSTGENETRGPRRSALLYRQQSRIQGVQINQCNGGLTLVQSCSLAGIDDKCVFYLSQV